LGGVVDGGGGDDDAHKLGGCTGGFILAYLALVGIVAIGWGRVL
jgi:hypothetical protein